jgi:hypothetical protein
MMEAARTSETLVNFYQTTRCYNPEDSNLHSHEIVSAVLRRQYLPSGWKYACVMSISKPGKDPRLSPSYKPKVYVTLLASSLRRSYSLGSSEK